MLFGDREQWLRSFARTNRGHRMTTTFRAKSLRIPVRNTAEGICNQLLVTNHIILFFNRATL
jgi:hypothetical protein